MTLLWAAFGVLGVGFGRLGAQPKHTASGGGGGGGATPTYYLYGF